MDETPNLIYPRVQFKTTRILFKAQIIIDHGQTQMKPSFFLSLFIHTKKIDPSIDPMNLATCDLSLQNQKKTP